MCPIVSNVLEIIHQIVLDFNILIVESVDKENITDSKILQKLL